MTLIKSQWVEDIRRVRAIGCEIGVLSKESKKLRKSIGKTAKEAGYHEPTKDNPVEFILATDDPSVSVLITITPDLDEDPADWNILSRKIPVYQP